MRASILSFGMVFAVGGCVQTPSIDNDRFASNLADAGNADETSDSEDGSAEEQEQEDAARPPSTPSPSTRDDAARPGSGQTGELGDLPDAATDAQAPVDVAPADASTPVDPPLEVDAGQPEPPEPMMSVVPGSATRAKCTSYGKASGTMCAGYYCGVTQEQIAAEMPADNLCGENAVQGACDNKLPTAVAKCARDVKSANALASNAQNRPKVQDCVFKDAELKAKTPLACMSCFLDAAECAGDNCLVECLAGDSRSCDNCRAKNKCDLKVFSCANLISPF